MTEITTEHVEKLLQHWGDEVALFENPPANWWTASKPSPLVEQIVDRSREDAIRAVMARKPRARVARRLILKQMREKGEKGRIPAWAGGDPVRCKETRKATVCTPERMDPVAEQVDRWVFGLWQWDPRAAMCLRAHYRHQARTGDGAWWVQFVTGLPVNRHGYLAGVARGRLHIQRCASVEIAIGA